MNLIIALATNDGVQFADSHFGEADEYYIYEINEKEAVFIKSVKNTSIEEKMHGDPKKAKSIIKILKDENVKAAVNTEFGRNIKRVNKKLVTIVSKEKNLNKELKLLIENFNLLLKSWEKGEEREIIYL